VPAAVVTEDSGSKSAGLLAALIAGAAAALAATILPNARKMLQIIAGHGALARLTGAPDAPRRIPLPLHRRGPRQYRPRHDDRACGAPGRGSQPVGSPQDMKSAYGHPQARPSRRSHVVAGGVAAGTVGALATAAMGWLKKRKRK
jgi:hypothetical protein